MDKKIEKLEKKNLSKKITIVILSAVLVFIIASAGILLFLGYRPIEDTDVIIQYDVIYIFVQLAAVISLIATVVYQVFKAKGISERQEKNNEAIAKRQEDLLKKQNEIALFEKKFELYESLVNLVGECKYYIKNIELGDYYLVTAQLCDEAFPVIREKLRVYEQLINASPADKETLFSMISELNSQIRVYGVKTFFEHQTKGLKMPMLFSDTIVAAYDDLIDIVKKFSDEKDKPKEADINKFKEIIRINEDVVFKLNDILKLQ